MAIGTYAELKTAVANWLHRSDLTTQIPDFIALCEADVRRDLRVREMEDSTSVALTSTELALPTGFLEARQVTLKDIVVDYVLPQQFTPISDDTTYQYTVKGTNFVFQTTSGTVKVDFYKGFAAFSADGDTNWLLTNHPDAYLFGSLAWACTYTQDDPMPHRAAYQAAIARVRQNQRNSLGPLVVRPDSMNTP
jgi:hypothetical protein